MTGRKFCRACGSQIPEDATYCPYCGTNLRPTPLPAEAKEERLGRLRFAVDKPVMTRIALFAVCLGLFMAGLLFGNSTTMDRETATEVLEPLKNFNPTIENIAYNNIFNVMLISTPGIGVLLLTYAGYNAGLIIAAIHIEAFGFNSLSNLIPLFQNPVFWLEATSFCLAASQGVMFILGGLTKRWREEGRNMLITMAICALVLLIAAYLEVAFYL